MKPHEELLSLQLVFQPDRFDISPPDGADATIIYND